MRHGQLCSWAWALVIYLHILIKYMIIDAIQNYLFHYTERRILGCAAFRLNWTWGCVVVQIVNTCHAQIFYKTGLRFFFKIKFYKLCFKVSFVNYYAFLFWNLPEYCLCWWLFEHLKGVTPQFSMQLVNINLILNAFIAYFNHFRCTWK